MLVGYARVSTKDQDHALQIDALKKAGCEKIFEEKASGAKNDRPVLAEVIQYMREGDVLVVWKLDRLSRSLKHLIETVEVLRERGIGLKSLTNPVDTTTASGKLVFNIFSALAEFERELIQERVAAGLAAARARGRFPGRPKLDDKKLKKAEALIAQGFSAKDAAKAAEVSRATLYNRGIVQKVSESNN